jgi:EpsI family protein
LPLDGEAKTRVNFLRNRYAVILTVVLLSQAGIFYAVAGRPEDIPAIAPLSAFPESLGGFSMIKSIPLDPEVQDLLKADDIMSRVYLDPSRTREALLFVAYFKTQRYGQSPHSPKNCLPGSGWEPIYTDRPSIQVPGWPRPIVVNRYVVEKGDAKNVTLYWYQTHSRVIASEYSAKFWLVADALRYRRSDTSLVRISVPVNGDDVDAAIQLAVQLAQAAFPQLLKQMPL